MDAHDDNAFLKDQASERTQRFLRKNNRRHKRFFRRHTTTGDVLEEMDRMAGKSEDGAPWVDDDGFRYQFV